MTVDLLVLGGSGFIGARTALSALQAGWSVACTAHTRPAPPGADVYHLDIHDPPALADCLYHCRPRSVIYSVLNWELASLPAQMYDSANGVKAVIAAMRAAGLSARLVYVSTNAVFSGNNGPYREYDAPDPENRTDAYRFYGAARRAGEMIALNEWDNTIVARTANVDGRDAWGAVNPRLASLIEPLRAGRSLPRYVDRIITPTLVDDLAAALVEIAAPDFARPSGGILHLAGREPVSDYQYARRLAAYLGCDPAVVSEDHYLPAGTRSTYNIGLECSYSRTLLKTQFGGLTELFARVFEEKPRIVDYLTS